MALGPDNQTKQHWDQCLLEVWRLSWCYIVQGGRKKVTMVPIGRLDLEQGRPLYLQMENVLQLWDKKTKSKLGFEICPKEVGS